MKRTNSDFKPSSIEECEQKIAYHEAGHATAIYLRNQQLNLPPVFFQIKFNTEIFESAQDEKQEDNLIHDNVAMIEGGCLIHSVTVSLLESSNFFSDDDHHAYLQAMQADIVNILAGPMAEAKFTAIRDQEWNETQFDNIEVLHNYGGSYDIEKINEYLSSYIPTGSQRLNVLESLITETLKFINTPANWFAISQLANAIYQRTSDTISCEQIAEIVDKNIELWNSGAIVSFNHGTQFRNKNCFAA